MGATTFEYDLLTGADGNTMLCLETLNDLCAQPSRTTIASWNGQAPDYAAFMKMITNAGGKGRYAQRLALRTIVPPPYVTDALNYLAQP